MKTQVKYRMQLAGMAVLGALTLLVIDGGQMGNADAGVRIRARLKTPHVTVQYQSGPVHHRRRVARPFIYRITPRDRAIARRLAWETGHRRIVLLDLRSRGLSWRQIGRRLGIGHRTIRLAMNGGYTHPSRHRGGRPGACSVRAHGR